MRMLFLMIKQLQMKKIIEFTKNWKHRNLLHVVGGFLMGAFLSWLFAWYISLVLIITFANYWEFCQKKDFGASEINASQAQLNIGTTFIIEEI